jgi:hypothetical protein
LHRTWWMLLVSLPLAPGSKSAPLDAPGALSAGAGAGCWVACDDAHRPHFDSIWAEFLPNAISWKQSPLQIEEVTTQDRATGMLFHEGDTIAGQLWMRFCEQHHCYSHCSLTFSLCDQGYHHASCKQNLPRGFARLSRPHPNCGRSWRGCRDLRPMQWWGSAIYVLGWDFIIQ